jgi:hypothetical protein
MTLPPYSFIIGKTMALVENNSAYPKAAIVQLNTTEEKHDC